jgi:hypothetical protein
MIRQWVFGGAIAICAGMAVGQAPTSVETYDSTALEQAQLRVLARSGEGDECQADYRPEIAKSLRDAYVARGMPLEGFSPARLRQVALEWTAQRLKEGGGIGVVNQARRDYHIGAPEDLYSLLPARKHDAVAQFQEFLHTRNPKLLKAVSSEPLDPRSVSGLIAIAERDEKALPHLMTVLENDWSSVGRTFLYRRLLVVPGAQQQLAVIQTLAKRQQIDSTVLREVVSKADERVTSEVFKLAEGALRSDPEARAFLRRQIEVGRQQNRERALRSISKRPCSKDLELVASVLEREEDPKALAGLLQNLGDLAGYPQTMAAIREFIANNPVSAVRSSAVRSIPWYVIKETDPANGTPPADRLSPDELRSLTAAAPQEVRDAVEDVLARAAASRAKRAEGSARAREHFLQLHSRPAE